MNWWHLGWFVSGALCGAGVALYLVVRGVASVGMPGSRRKWGRPQ